MHQRNRRIHCGQEFHSENQAFSPQKRHPKKTPELSLSLSSHVDFCRYAFKLTYDEAVLREVTSEDELTEYKTEYDRDWYLGTETDHDWQLSIMNEKPFLFSLGRDKGKVGCYSK